MKPTRESLLRELKDWLRRARRIFPGLTLLVRTYLGWKE